eukprot:1483431-Prymnesium_polylepis.1
MRRSFGAPDGPDGLREVLLEVCALDPSHYIRYMADVPDSFTELSPAIARLTQKGVEWRDLSALHLVRLAHEQPEATRQL